MYTLRSKKGRAARWAAVPAALLLAGCGATVAESEDEDTVTVPRCGEDITYTTPQRTVAYEGGSADKLFALGLTDHVHGYVLPPANPPVSESPWVEEYEQVEFLSDDLLNRELVVDAEADFVVAGWESGFSEERGITSCTPTPSSQVSALWTRELWLLGRAYNSHSGRVDSARAPRRKMRMLNLWNRTKRLKVNRTQPPEVSTPPRVPTSPEKNSLATPTTSRTAS